jgi:YVTN family beta-propeller protein
LREPKAADWLCSTQLIIEAENGMTMKNAIAGAVLCAAAGSALAGPLAYVPNEKSGTVSVIDTGQDKVGRTIGTGGQPRGVAVSPDGATLYVSDRASNSLLVVELVGGTVRDRIALGESPEGIDLSRDGSLLAAASEVTNGVILLETGGAKHKWTIPVPGKNPEHAAFSPDGRWLLVGAEDGSQVDIVDVAQKKVAGSVAVGQRPRGIGFTPDGKTAYVACELDGTLYAIDMATRSATPFKAGPFSNGVTVAPGGAKVYVSSGRGARVDVFDVASKRFTASIPVGQRPWNMAVTPDGKKLYVANGRSGTVSVIDTVQGKRVADVKVDELPWGVAIR